MGVTDARGDQSPACQRRGGYASAVETQAALTAADKTRCPDTAERMEVLARARELLEQMDDPELPADDFHALDAQFHILLSSLSGNVVLETMMTSIREATIGYVQETVAKLHIWSDVSRTLQAHHWKILEAVQRRDGERACQLLREHITWSSGLGARGAR
ncbi:FadR/GntR family transcriptional regulator [Corynebacterium yudongzhengii]|uniref:FadR/GntR family transcriptional regulator n=1 Tax=Corynebacterium yudongzhengii TaxID=2080740 RepID=UPI001F2465C0|nr:FCD domain-containing protein [Corynebacterium yudongzhengii]